MITNINFPEGTVFKLNRGSFLDQFSKDYDLKLANYTPTFSGSYLYSAKTFTQLKDYYYAFQNSRVYYRHIPEDATSVERCFERGNIGYDYTFNNTDVLSLTYFASYANYINRFFTLTAGKVSLNYSFEYASRLRFLTLNVDTSDQSYMQINPPNTLCALLGTVSVKSMGNISQSNLTGYSQMNYLREVILRDLGTNKNQTSVSFAYWPVWGYNSAAQPDAKKSLIDTLITYSFDRASAGYSTCTIKLSAATKSLLTEEEIAQITAKGYTIS